jgi:hypothetical protein
MSGERRRDLVLALYPFTRGIAFTLFEGPLSPVDWGVKEIRGRQRNLQSLEVSKRLIERLQPDIAVLLNLPDPHGRRAKRIGRLQRLIASCAESQAIEVHHYTRQDIRECFRGVGALTRYEIAQAIASQIHALRSRLPPPRKIWKAEESRMSIFDAASLVMTFYCQGGGNSLQEVER